MNTLHHNFYMTVLTDNIFLHLISVVSDAHLASSIFLCLSLSSSLAFFCLSSSAFSSSLSSSSTVSGLTFAASLLSRSARFITLFGCLNGSALQTNLKISKAICLLMVQRKFMKATKGNKSTWKYDYPLMAFRKMKDNKKEIVFGVTFWVWACLVGHLY